MTAVSTPSSVTPVNSALPASRSASSPRSTVPESSYGSPAWTPPDHGPDSTSYLSLPGEQLSTWYSRRYIVPLSPRDVWAK